ncbi:MAG TPA: OsmC family protein [Allosphingosinicella sp.]|nr:OsmC family protein [Allosphingosinicella sp.]
MTQQQPENAEAVVARLSGDGRFQTRISVRGTSFFADEPVEVGGGGTGPTPFELLSAALAACTAMTLRLYAERKGWDLPDFTVEAAHALASEPGGRDRFVRRIALDGAVDDERAARLLEIADKCPVHRTLVRGFEIVTESGASAVHTAPEPPTRHEEAMEQACAD